MKSTIEATEGSNPMKLTLTTGQYEDCEFIDLVVKNKKGSKKLTIAVPVSELYKAVRAFEDERVAGLEAELHLLKAT